MFLSARGRKSCSNSPNSVRVCAQTLGTVKMGHDEPLRNVQQFPKAVLHRSGGGGL